MTGLWIRQMEHIRGHLWYRYSVIICDTDTPWSFVIQIFRGHLWYRYSVVICDTDTPWSFVIQILRGHLWYRYSVVICDTDTPWSFVIQILRSGYRSHGGGCKTIEVMTSTYPLGTLGSVASLVSSNFLSGK